MVQTSPASSFKVRAGCLALLVVALDQWSKWLIEQRFEKFESIDVIANFFSIVHVSNTGIAFGLFRSHGNVGGTALLAILGFSALAIVAYFYWRTPHHHVLLLTALALVLGGAVGNLIDRVLLGAVTDFFDFYLGSRHWPTFNVADSAITTGIGLLAVETLLARPARDETETAGPTESFAGDSG